MKTNLKPSAEIKNANLVMTLYVNTKEKIRKGDVLLCEREDGSFIFAPCLEVEGEGNETEYEITSDFGKVAQVIGKVIAVIE